MGLLLKEFKLVMLLSLSCLLGSLNLLGVVCRFSCSYDQKKSRILERKHRHIVETGLTLLAHANMSLRYYDEDFSSAVILINKFSTVVLIFSSPWQCLFGLFLITHFLKSQMSLLVSPSAI